MFCFFIVYGLILWIWLKEDVQIWEVLTYVYICLWQSLIVLRWPCAADRMLQSLLTQVWSEWYYWLVTILKYSCIIAKSLAWYFNVSCLLRGEDSCNPRFDQSWKSWPLVPVTSSNWEWATAASSSHTYAGWTCHTCRLPLSHLCRLNQSHLRAAPVTHLQAEPVTPLQAEPATHQPMPLWHWHPNSRICHPGLPSWQMSEVQAAGQRKWRSRSSCGDRQQHWERLQTLLLVLDYLSMTHQNAEVQHAWILMAPPPI